VNFDIIIQYKPTKCTLSKVIFYFTMSSTCFEPEGSSSGRRLYVCTGMVQCVVHGEITIKDIYL